MRPEFLDFSPHSETLIAVVLGATLATVSGVIATQLETFLRRRERERAAALLFGEVLSTIHVILVGAAESRMQGDPYGPITERMLRTGRREIDLFDRNREALYDLRDANLRVDLQSMMVRVAMPLDGVLDAIPAKTDAIAQARDRGFGFLMESVVLLPELVGRLGRVARHDFGQYAGLLANMRGRAPGGAALADKA